MNTCSWARDLVRLGIRSVLLIGLLGLLILLTPLPVESGKTPCPQIVGVLGSLLDYILPSVSACPAPPPADPAIAFVANDHSYPSVMVMNIDGSNNAAIYRAAKFACCLSFPSWSPDGKSIAFTDDGRIFRIDVVIINGVPEGTNLVLLTDADQWVFYPAWSPTGNEIAFAQRSPEGLWGIKVIPASGGTVSTLFTVNAGEGAGFPAWSSNASLIAFGFNDAYGVRSVKILDRATGAITKTFSAGQFGGISAIDWARNADVLVFDDGGNGDPANAAIHTLDLNSGIFKRVTAGQFPTWSPNNSKIAYDYPPGAFNRAITILDLTSNTIKQLDPGSHPDWRRF